MVRSRGQITIRGGLGATRTTFGPSLFAEGSVCDTKRVDLLKNEQYDPAYLTYNPKGVVPTLVHNDKPMVESTLICEYLDKA